jgi:diacylglycerol kinase (ATP)
MPNSGRKNHKTALLIYNPTAGAFPSGMIIQKVSRLLIDHDWDLEVIQSRDGPHITQLAQEAARNGLDATFIAGGDGSINLAMAGLIGTETALGVLPAGTSNVLAQELGLIGAHFLRLGKLEEAARKLVTGHVQRVDIGYCNKNPFLLWAGVGLDGFLVHRIEPRKPWEKQLSVLLYTSKAVWNLHFWSGINLEVETDSEIFHGNYLMAVASNIHLYAGGLAELSPSAMMDDGIMDLWLFKGNTPIDSYQRALDLFTKRHVSSENFICVPFRQLVIRSEAPLFTQLDAEPYIGKGEIKLEVAPRNLRLIVPGDVRSDLFGYPPDGFTSRSDLL